jgi:hypothetical protein
LSILNFYWPIWHMLNKAVWLLNHFNDPNKVYIFW